MRYTANVISYLTSDTFRAAPPAVVFRQPTAGPELDFVMRYCQEHLVNFERGSALSIFLEPKLDSGFPDIVAVFWDREIAKKWPIDRIKLLPADIQIVHHVNMAGKIPVEMLVKRFGIRKASDMMLRLSDARLVDVQSEEICRKPLDDIFATNRIVAIEAKVRDWRNGLKQAFQNTWFASESYLLLNSLPQSNEVAVQAEKLGVGVLHKEQSLLMPHVKSQVSNLPASYVSWLFNEWAWRYSILEEE